MRALAAVALTLTLVGCGGSDDTSAGAGGSAGSAIGGGAGTASGGSAGSATGGAAGNGGSAGTASGGSAGSAGAGGQPPCDFAAPVAPPASVLWAAPLSGTGADTLGGHSHDDGNGPVGFCAGTPESGQPFYRLIAAGFETDTDIDNDGDQSDALSVDFYKDAASFTGYGESGGRVSIYVQIVDLTGSVLNVLTNPEIHVVRSILNGPTESFPLTDKPANEFQTNFPMTGGGTRYSIAIEGQSDRVINMRLPVNHHVTYVLIFRREG